jgi:citrate lyase subunit beta/citryl-CoA lyase
VRSWLFAPGHEGRKARKAVKAGADFAVLDWEDAVPAARKQAAREETLAVKAELERDDPEALSRLCVRINDPSSEFFAADLEALDGWKPAVVVVPKVDDLSDVDAAAGCGAPLMLLIESALGVERAFEVARGHDLVRYLAFGPLDLLADLGGSWTEHGEETLYARSRVAIAARAARLVAAIDGPWPDLEDLEGLREDTDRGRRMGYGGRLAIHPAQLGTIQAAYAPSEDDLEFARRVVTAAEEAERSGRSALSVDGRFVDAPVVKWAHRVLASEEG